MTKLQVSDAIFRSFPDVVLGVVAFQKIDNAGERAEVMDALRLEEARIRTQFAQGAINDHPQIAPWREAYRKFGAKPKDYASSIENLVRRAVKGHTIPHINLLVDLYNTISLRHIVPLGGEDIDKIEGDVELTFATEHEAPVRLLGEAEERAPRPGEVIYKDRIGAICRRWNWKEADRTKFTEQTTRGFLVVEALPPVERRLVEQAVDELSVLIETYCGGQIRTGIVDGAHPSVLLHE